MLTCPCCINHSFKCTEPELISNLSKTQKSAFLPLFFRHTSLLLLRVEGFGEESDADDTAISTVDIASTLYTPPPLPCKERSALIMESRRSSSALCGEKKEMAMDAKKKPNRKLNYNEARVFALASINLTTFCIYST